ncbi:flagellar biosynthetic protein FliO [Entomospira nematocerorum]|uniref:FliO/MopB family protein n=1 Tax=Entomospira nematocerorum TaxID=2719987 RepID=A0A968GDD8_9SPIO|nr:flagellar biosynthetic protein FliO [Entomospira nematocera]NIZ47007.1 FliO/MopB family protein [Entomospira nematocera]WDI34448.1 flagellar biosynthetic protein FliO [Entomospira nematocera]
MLLSRTLLLSKIIFILTVLFMSGLFSFAQEDIGINNQDESTLLLDTQSDNELTVTPSQSIGFVGFLQAFLSLLFVLGLIYITIFFLKKFSGKQGSESSQIQILETQTLKSGALISIVDIAGKIFILGVGDNITPIAEITDKESIDTLRLSQSHKTTTQPERFMTLLQSRFKKSEPIAESSTRETQAPIHNKDFLKTYTDRLHQSKEPFQEDTRNE